MNDKAMGPKGKSHEEIMQYPKASSGGEWFQQFNHPFEKHEEKNKFEENPFIHLLSLLKTHKTFQAKTS